jgi:integrase
MDGWGLRVVPGRLDLTGRGLRCWSAVFLVGVTMNVFDVRIYAMRRRHGRRRPFEVRWHAAGRARSRSFTTRGLADSYRAELVRAARTGLEFSMLTGEPAAWAGSGPPAISWVEHAACYAAMKWPQAAAHTRAAIADALATVTPALTTGATGRPPAAALRAALYGHAFNPARAGSGPGPATAAALRWAQCHSLPLARLSDPQVARRALESLSLRRDGTRAAATTITRKRAVFYNALGYAAELGLLPANPLDRISWKPPKTSGTVDPRTVVTPAQVQAILTEVTRTRPELTAFFGCLYYAALRPAEAVALHRGDCDLPAAGWGQLTLTSSCPRSARAWTTDGTPHEQRGLKLRPHGAIRTVPIPPQLVRLLRQHIRACGTTPGGRLFRAARAARGGLLHESCYGRTWHTSRAAALGPALAPTPLARRPYDLRHAALSLWLAAGAPPAEIAARAGHSPHVLLTVYAHCIPGHGQIASSAIEQALTPGNGLAAQWPGI